MLYGCYAHSCSVLDHEECVVIIVFYFRDEKVSLEQQMNMKEKQMQATKQEINKIKGEIEEVCFRPSGCSLVHTLQDSSPCYSLYMWQTSGLSDWRWTSVFGTG